MAKYSCASLDTAFSALSVATRRVMLERLSHGQASVTQLTEPFADNYGGGWGGGLEKLREQIETAKTN